MRMAAILTTLALGAADPPSSDAIRRAADEVYRRPEFGPQTNIWLRLLEPLGQFFRWLGTLSGGNPLLFWVLFIGCVLLLVLMIALLVYQVRFAFAKSAGRRGAKATAAERVRQSADCRARADDCAARGEYTEAVRQLFLALVYRFDESGRVGFQKAYTNREYLALIDDRQDARVHLRLFVDALDDHWYGQRASDRGLYESCLARYELLAP